MPPAQLTVVIPAYNERVRLSATVMDIARHLEATSTTFELIVSDDGSDDGTDELTRELSLQIPQVRLVRSDANRGKGHAVKLGLRSASGERVLFCDADGATPISQLSALEDALDDGAAIAVGSRSLDAADVERHTRLHRRVMGRVFARMLSRRLEPHVSDTQCGFKLFTAEAAAAVAAQLTVDGFAFDLEIFVIARANGMRVVEVPVSWNEVAGSKVRMTVDPIRMIRDARQLLRMERAGHYRL